MINHYNTDGLDWFFWNAAKLSFYNFIMLVPLGIYLSIFHVKGVKKAAFIIFSISFGIEIFQLVFGYFGMISSLRELNVDDIILNTAGGIVGYCVFMFAKKRFVTYRKTIS